MPACRPISTGHLPRICDRRFLADKNPLPRGKTPDMVKIVATLKQGG